jgi:hypothetical protein
MLRWSARYSSSSTRESFRDRPSFAIRLHYSFWGSGAEVARSLPPMGKEIYITQSKVTSRRRIELMTLKQRGNIRRATLLSGSFNVGKIGVDMSRLDPCSTKNYM